MRAAGGQFAHARPSVASRHPTAPWSHQQPAAARHCHPGRNRILGDPPSGLPVRGVGASFPLLRQRAASHLPNN